MNITSLSSNSISVSDTGSMNTIDISLLKKSLESVELNSDMMNRMLEQSVNPLIGSNIDIRL